MNKARKESAKKKDRFTAGMAMLPRAALLSALLVLAACEGAAGNGTGGGSFEAKLRGTWETHNPGPYDYSGTLAIDRDTITITGYDQPAYYPSPLKESERPFKGITKKAARKGYSEEGKIYINDFGWQEGIAYDYDAGVYPAYTKLLRFTFGGRTETLLKTGE
jgi:hypothetical protein